LAAFFFEVIAGRSRAEHVAGDSNALGTCPSSMHGLMIGSVSK
jgi:hypothetical protein